MLSNFSVWDFYRERPSIILEGEKQSFAFLAFDPHIEHFFLNRFKKILSSRIEVKIGSEVTREWIEANFLSLSLFGELTYYIVIQSENIAEDAQQYLIEILGKGDSYEKASFFFSKKTSFFEKLSKRLMAFQISSPAFWEGDKLLNYLCNEFSIKIGREVFDYLISNLECDCNTYSGAMSQLRLFTLSGESDKVFSDLELAKKVVGLGKIDLFGIAKLLNKKKIDDYLKELEVVFLNGVDFRQTVVFLGGHLFKVMDTSYLLRKKKLSRYDKEIQEAAKLWGKGELARELRFLGKLELLSKKDPQKAIVLIRDRFLG
jgi:hypothetical protein